MILCLHSSLLPILILPKAVILYITKNICQLVCFLDHIKPLGIVNNKSVTWNRAINQVQYVLRYTLKIPINNSILHDVIYDESQRGWIEQTVLIFYGLNIKIRTDDSYTIPPLCPCPNIIHMIEEILLWLLIFFKSLCDKRRRFQDIWLNIRRFHSLLHLFQIFCSYFSHRCDHTRLSQTTLILFI